MKTTREACLVCGSLALLALCGERVVRADAAPACESCTGATVEGTRCGGWPLGGFAGRCVLAIRERCDGCPPPCFNCTDDCSFEEYQNCDGLAEGDPCAVPACEGWYRAGTGTCVLDPACVPGEYSNCLTCNPEILSTDADTDGALDAEPLDAPDRDGAEDLPDPGADVDAGRDAAAPDPDVTAGGGGCECTASHSSAPVEAAAFFSAIFVGLAAVRKDRRRRGSGRRT